MKIYNRRDFLKLTGMSALALTLAACSDGPSVPAAPAAPAQDAQTLFAAINASRKEKGLKELVYNKTLDTWAHQDAKCFETANSTAANLENWRFMPSVDDKEDAAPKLEYLEIQMALQKEGFVNADAELYGMEETSSSEYTLNKLYPETEEALKAQMEEMAAEIGDRMRYIGIAPVKVGGKTYWIAVMFGKKPTDT